MRRLFHWLPKSRGKRLVAIVALILGSGFLCLVALAITAFFLFRSPKFQSWLWPALMRRQANVAPSDPPAVPAGPAYNGRHPSAADIHAAADLFQTTNDPKTKTTERQQQRVIEVARLVAHANDTDFAKWIGEFFDLAECARFLAVEVMLAHYDGILAQGQNFLLYLDPRSDKFGLIPWDLDHSWGEFPFISTADQRERASVWHPWVGENRFLQRLFAVEDFKKRYQAELERLLTTLFVPERLNRRIDELAAVVRPAIAEESPERLAKFETAVSDQIHNGRRDGSPFDPNRPVHQLKRFIATRAQNVREQLAGKTQGVVLVRQNLMRR